MPDRIAGEGKIVKEFGVFEREPQDHIGTEEVTERDSSRILVSYGS